MLQETVVGLDVHADSITAAILPPNGDIPEVVKLSGDLMHVRRLFRRLSEEGPVRSCYEASGAGFVLQRLLTYDGFSCEVIAPSLIPRKPGDHRKTDRLDAIMLARLYRSGHLTAVHVPDENHEALRGSCDSGRPITATVQPPCSASRASCVTTGTSSRKARVPGPRSIVPGSPSSARRPSKDPSRRRLRSSFSTWSTSRPSRLLWMQTWTATLRSPSSERTVEALCCLRGVKTLTALTLLVEIGDVRRFRSPRSLMAYFGLVPSEYSSGSREYRGSITKAGNVHVRRLLVEAAWNNRHNAGAALVLKRRRQGQPPQIVAIALKAQHRLVNKFLRLDQRKHRHVAITAVARELCGFVWAILMASPETQN